MAATSQKEFRTPIVTEGMTPREIGKVIREFQNRLNETRVLADIGKKRPRGVRLERGEAIEVEQKRLHLAPKQAIVDGHRYVRLCDWGNPASEVLVRVNLEQFISEVRGVIKTALREKKTGLVVQMCREYEDGIKMADFVTKSGTPLSKNRAFSEAITQFFKDEPLVLKIVNDCLREYRKEKIGKAPADIPVLGEISSS